MGGGDVINATIAMIAKVFLDKDVDYTHLSVKGISLDDMNVMLNKVQPKAYVLSSLINNRKAKETEKYDKYLPINLMDKEYAQKYINVDGAWRIMRKIVEENNSFVNHYN